MTRLLALAMLLTLGFSGGCATIVQGTDQPVKFSYKGQDDSKVSSTIGKVSYSNGPSSGTCTIPGAVSIERSNNPLKLVFTYQDDQGREKTTNLTIPSTETGWMAGNAGIAVASLGIGAIGAIVDGITNASREYAEEFILDPHTGLVVLRYEDDKKFYVYDESTRKFLETDQDGKLTIPPLGEAQASASR